MEGHGRIGRVRRGGEKGRRSSIVVLTIVLQVIGHGNSSVGRGLEGKLVGEGSFVVGGFEDLVGDFKADESNERWVGSVERKTNERGQMGSRERERGRRTISELLSDLNRGENRCWSVEVLL